ncbi:ATPase, F1 complex, gamma subunit domain-containing protein [Mycena rebaudengoi]|nr:ATPase, F1 complex, gamma subunit domain-containing protein [Mycena rebaudengoi]
MLSRSSVAGTRLSRHATLNGQNGARTMATLREIEMRLKSVRNIEKITKSMKIVASTKVVKATKAMQAGRTYGLANSEVFTHTALDASANTDGIKRLFLVISSDKGLCGGIHSSVSKATRRALSSVNDSPLQVESEKSGSAPMQVDKDSAVMIVGDKSKSQLVRAVPGNVRLTFNQVGRAIPTFADAAGIADLIVKSGEQWDVLTIIYNKYVSAISYEAAASTVLGPSALKSSTAFAKYEMENSDEFTKDLAEFALANAVFAALVESHACEQNARRTAMDNASKNAGEMITALQMKYNRGRQAAITNELVDIITGACCFRFLFFNFVFVLAAGERCRVHCRTYCRAKDDSHRDGLVFCMS